MSVYSIATKLPTTANATDHCLLEGQAGDYGEDNTGGWGGSQFHSHSTTERALHVTALK